MRLSSPDCRFDEIEIRTKILNQASVFSVINILLLPVTVFLKNRQFWDWEMAHLVKCEHGFPAPMLRRRQVGSLAGEAETGSQGGCWPAV